MPPFGPKLLVAFILSCIETDTEMGGETDTTNFQKSWIRYGKKTTYIYIPWDKKLKFHITIHHLDLKLHHHYQHVINIIIAILIIIINIIKSSTFSTHLENQSLTLIFWPNFPKGTCLYGPQPPLTNTSSLLACLSCFPSVS